MANIKPPKNKREEAERFLHAARVMSTIPQKEFDLNDWGRTNCTTHACIAGHCAMDPWFYRRGFGAWWVPDYIDDNEKQHWILKANIRGSHGWSKMIKRFFGPQAHSSYVNPNGEFLYGSYSVGDPKIRTPKQAAKAIRDFVKKYYNLTNKDFRSLQKK